MTKQRGSVCLVIAVPVAIMAACGGNSSTTNGALTMKLTGESNGVTYRLRNATFDINGPEIATVDTEDDPEATSIDLSLSSGHYEVLLRDGWALQRMDAEGPTTVQATLVSANPLETEIIAGSRSHSVFRFSTDGGIVDIGTGELSITFEVDGVDSDDGGVPTADSCDPLQPETTCPTGEGCYISSSDGDGACLPAGRLVVGDECSSVDECAPGSVCTQDPSTEALRCIELCDLAAPDCSTGACADMGIPEIGLCL